MPTAQKMQHEAKTGMETSKPKMELKPSFFCSGQVVEAVFFQWVFSTIPFIWALNSDVLTCYPLFSQEGHLAKVSSIQFQADAEYDRLCICLRITSNPSIFKGFRGWRLYCRNFSFPPKNVCFDI